MGDPIEKQRQKQAFLAIIKWCSRQTGAKIMFDEEEGGCPRADVHNRIIHMPKRISVASSDAVLATLIHESMHIKHTPKWLSDLCRDPVDHFIFNGLEDCRIETIAVGQLKALTFFLKKMVYDAKRRHDRSQTDLGSKVILNIACKASGVKICDDRDTRQAENTHKKLIADLRDIYRRIFTVNIAKSFKSNVEELYVKLDEFRAIFNMPKLEPEKEKQQQKSKDGNGIGGEDIRAAIGIQRVKEIETAIQEIAVMASKTPGSGFSHDEDSLDLSELGLHLIDLNEQARARIKESLKKSLNEIIDEGTTLNCDNLTALLTGDIDEVFSDTKIEKKMRTKVYFLMDVSSSMGEAMSLPDLDAITGKTSQSTTRLQVSVSAFKAISEVMDEAKDMYGVDLDYENFMFGDSCYKVQKMGESDKYCGGGTNLGHAFKVVMKHVHQDDPANKRIVCILTDGEVGNVDAIREQIAREAQDIRIVFVGIGEANVHCRALIRHNITCPDTAEAVLIDSFEEAL